MSDRYADRSTSLDSPARAGAAVTANDSTDLATASRALYVGTGGDVKIDFVAGGGTVTFPDVPSGSWLPVCAARVYATGTTASDIIAVW